MDDKERIAIEHEEYVKSTTEFQAGQEIFNQISRNLNYLNCMGGDFNLGKGFLDKLNREHPTLQQQLFSRLIVPMIKFWAERYENKFYDMRNEATCKICYEMWKDLKDVGFPFI
jgi:hypothetical protein